MRVVILGASGQLGADLLDPDPEEGAGFEIVPLTHASFDITDPQAASRLAELRPQAVINTAAYHRVDEVEGQPDRAFSLNALAPHRLALECHRIGAAFVYISTDYVFGGDRCRRRAYTESDSPAPVNVYGASKLAGEVLVRCATPKHFIVRTSGLFGLRGASGKGGNFIERMLAKAAQGAPLRVVDDQRLSPTSTRDLAGALYRLLRSERYGLYHLTNAGECSWFEFAETIFKLAGVRASLSPTSSQSFQAAAARPEYSVLESTAWTAAGLPPLRPWPAALADYLHLRRADVARAA